MQKELEVARHELKYYISRSDYEYAHALLSELMHHDSHQIEKEGYFIRSLYFDDMMENSVEEKLAGVEHRDKYRLRIYEFDQNWAKLERKRKNGNYVQKSTGVITRKEAEELIQGNHDILLNYKVHNLNSIYFDFKRKFLRPVVIVDYIRDVYMLDYNDIRITFDKHLRANDQNLDLFNPEIITEPLQRDEVIIMEIKFNHFLPPWFKDFLRFDSAMSSAISKYCQCRMKTREFYYHHR